MILIADSGSTKTDWVLTGGKNTQQKIRYNTSGYNPYFINTDSIYNSVTSALTNKIDSTRITRIFFYGAGCSTSENNDIVYKALIRCFPNAEVVVKHDMLAAARALLGSEKGFAAILGTGSNTCVYNGKEIVKHIDSLGYLLGDEGSGSFIGKTIARDYMRGYLPPELKKKFVFTYKSNHAEIFESIYNQPFPNRFLAGFCRFAYENIEHDYIQQIVRNSFNEFFKNIVTQYPDYRKYEFNCVGSVAYNFKSILNNVAASYSMQVGKIIASPIDRLVDYHLNDVLISA